jgi:heterodisulfide reductase subunit A
MVSEVNPALCQGCGTCVAGCPAGAISGTGFSNEQILSQIDGLLLLNISRTAVPVE